MGPDVGSPAHSTLDVARTVAESVRSHDAVVELDAGLAGEFATYGLNGRAPGVRVETDRDGTMRVRVRVVIRFGRPIPDLGDEIRSVVVRRLRELGVDATVDIHVAGITETADSTRRASSPALDTAGPP